MIRAKFISLLFIWFSFFSIAKTQHQYFKDGIDAFNKKEFTTAIHSFEKELKEAPQNISAQFNLGLSYSAQKNYGRAILAFERVLKKIPNDYEAIDNIKYAYSKLNNGEEWISDITPLQRALYSITSTQWSYTSIVLSVLFALTLYLIRSINNRNNKRLLLLFSGLLIALLFFSLYTASEVYYYETSRDTAIVTMNNDQTNTLEKTSKNTGREQQIQIGTKVKKIGPKKGELQEVQTKNGKTYFVRNSEIEII